MGLLDDAIREHLDLKRARGADPAEVERLEREALGPVRRDPTIGAAHYEAPEHHDERLRSPEDLGYHDSTAPHSESHVEQRAPASTFSPMARMRWRMRSSRSAASCDGRVPPR